MPILNNCIPPKNIIAAIIEVHPACALVSIIFLIIMINKYINPIIERKSPKITEILNGFIEKPVNPFIHNSKSLLIV